MNPPSDDTQPLKLDGILLPPPEDPSDGIAVEKAASDKREAAMDEEALRTWHGVQLKKWSRERQRLLDALVAADVPQPDLASADPVAYVNGAYPMAVKVLYLLHHEPHEWESLRPRLLSVIDRWASSEYVPPGMTDEELDMHEGRVNVPDSTLDEKMEAIRFANNVVTAYQIQMALPKPSSRRSKRSAVGN